MSDGDAPSCSLPPVGQDAKLDYFASGQSKTAPSDYRLLVLFVCAEMKALSESLCR